ncbi:MAG: hypothetical protein BGO95_08695 [Micrococcales bacterium 73-13]|nr:MAG: hypothetical protein BGO95_08695 [Micrococcales bacterium 73-13]
MSELSDAIRLVADANHVLVARGVLDAYGHVSMRHPEDPERYLLARNLAPALVQPEDVQVYSLDSTTEDERPGYLERFIHGEIYRRHPGVHAVVHSHSASMVPFSISRRPLQAVWHMAGFLGPRVPVFEIRDVAGEGSDLLIRSEGLGAALAEALGESAVVLMRGHGSVAVGDSIPQAVHRAVFAELNARAQATAVGLGEFTSLTAAEGAAAAESNYGQIRRAWELWRAEVER